MSRTDASRVKVCVDNGAREICIKPCNNGGATIRLTMRERGDRLQSKTLADCS